MYLPDTNFIIKALAGENPYSEKFFEWIVSKKLNLSVITLSEFLVKADEEEEETIEKLISEIEPLSIDTEIAKAAALYRKTYSTKTKKAYLVDCLIAATAKIHRLTLVTLNKADYPMKDIKILGANELIA